MFFMLSDEQIQKIKTHLLDQLVNFPEDQRKMMKHKILSMTDPEVEEFVKENQLEHLQDPESSALTTQPKCIFCAIIEGKIPSYKIYEDKEHIGILEINPLSKGHSLLVPKKHMKLEEISQETLETAKKISKHIQEKLNPLEVKAAKNNILGHSLVEIVPIFGNEKDRQKAEKENLEKLQKELEFKEIKEVQQIHPSGKDKLEEKKAKKEEDKKEVIKLRPRMP